MKTDPTVTIIVTFALFLWCQNVQAQMSNHIIKESGSSSSASASAGASADAEAEASVQPPPVGGIPPPRPAPPPPSGVPPAFFPGVGVGGGAGIHKNLDLNIGAGAGYGPLLASLFGQGGVPGVPPPPPPPGGAVPPEAPFPPPVPPPFDPLLGGPGYMGFPGFMGPSYIPSTWLGSALSAKGDLLFPIVIFIFVIVGIWTVVQFLLALVVPLIAGKLALGKQLLASKKISSFGFPRPMGYSSTHDR